MNHRYTLLPIIVLLLASGETSAQPPQFAITPLGLTDAEHTHSVGTQFSAPFAMNATGHVVGTSQRFSSGNGQSVWLYDGTSSVNIGLTDPVHTGGNGIRHSSPIQINAAGHVLGSAFRYNGGNGGDSTSAWLYNGVDTIVIGLVDVEHSHPLGIQYIAASKLNAAGQAIGSAERFEPGEGASRGRSAWFFNGTTTINAGLTDAQHTRLDGGRTSTIEDLNDAGLMVGRSIRSDGGQTAWIFDGTTHTRVGLVDAEHTRSDGRQSSSAFGINAVGQVIGNSVRYNGESSAGESAWLYDGTSYTILGLTDAEHTMSNGSRRSGAIQINAAGHVTGISHRFDNGSIPYGQSAWLYNGTTTIKLGILDSEHAPSGKRHQFHQPIQINAAGHVIGLSERRIDGVGKGQSVWLYDGSSTINIGLTDAVHTRDDGYRFSQVSQVNSAGQVIGYAERYEGATYLGQSAWFYEPMSGVATPIDVSFRSDGYAESKLVYLGDDGVAVGYYGLHDGMTLVGVRAMYWSPESGVHDLGELVHGGLDSYDWEAIHRAIQANGVGQIAGYGVIDGLPPGSQSAFLLSMLSTPIPGDADHSGTVDRADLAIFTRHYGMSEGADWSMGDFDGDGRTTLADMAILKANLSSSAAHAQLAVTNVPEPSGILLAVIAGLVSFVKLRVRLAPAPDRPPFCC